MEYMQEELGAPVTYKGQFNAVVNAHGLYNTEQFVLRLSPLNHQLIDEATIESSDQSKVDHRTIVAYSTYIHETIHWWQHIGSTAGFVLSMCYPLQTHSNVKLIRDWCSLGPAEKSIKTSALRGELAGKLPNDPRQAACNAITNNTMDFEFFKVWVLDPEKSLEAYNDPYFESQGHCFSIVYMNLLSAVSDIVDPDGGLFCNLDEWETQFTKLASEKIHGYYYGSPLMRRRVGVAELFEGQACFSQMQYLAGVGASSPGLAEFKSAGRLFGIYEKAFSEFLDMSGLSCPIDVTDSIVGMFLLVCDLSINPVEGFPCDIQDYPKFVHCADPGIRFEILSRTLAELNTDMPVIHDYSKQEYEEISAMLLEAAGLQKIRDGWDSIKGWLRNSEELHLLMKEHADFNFDTEDTVLRVLLSSFISFNMDKSECPEFFCWPGYWKSNRQPDDRINDLWSRNLSIFTDSECEDGIFIRKFPGKNEDNLANTLNNFFGNNLIYNLSRQWVLRDDDFSYDFRWLSDTVGQDEWKEFGNKAFEKLYGVSIDNIVTCPQPDSIGE